MKEIIAWLNSALAGKELSAGMTYYKINDNTISATDGKLTACAPWKWGGKFFVPGDEFEKVLKRMPGEPTIVEADGGIKIKSGRFSGFIQALPLTEWGYPGVETAKWKKIPDDFFPLLIALRPFISENEQPAWGHCIALSDGWAFATNNIVVAGGACKGLKGIQSLLPAWAVDFVLNRMDGLIEWSWDNNFMAFRWNNKAWCRTQLIVGQFPEKAAVMVQQSVKVKTTQKIDDTFREAMERVGELAEDTVSIYAKRIESQFGKAIVEDGIQCEVPKGSDRSVFGAKYLLPVLKVAESWSPSTWPTPSPWKGKLISGYIVGRRV